MRYCLTLCDFNVSENVSFETHYIFSNNSFHCEDLQISKPKIKICTLLTCNLGRYKNHRKAITTRRDLSLLWNYQDTISLLHRNFYPLKILLSFQLPSIFTVHVFLKPGFKLSQLVLCPFHHMHGRIQVSTAHAVVDQCPDRMAFHLTVLKMKDNF